MNSKKHIQQEKVNTLLAQYRRYCTASSSEKKKAIADQMFFDDPVVWILYKKQAYQDSMHPLTSWGDLVDHSTAHDGICGRRLRFLQIAVLKLFNKDILSPHIVPRTMPLQEVVSLPYIEGAIENDTWSTAWSAHEYYKEGDVIAKWKRFTE